MSAGGIVGLTFGLVFMSLAAVVVVLFVMKRQGRPIPLLGKSTPIISMSLHWKNCFYDYNIHNNVWQHKFKSVQFRSPALVVVYKIQWKRATNLYIIFFYFLASIKCNCLILFIKNINGQLNFVRLFFPSSQTFVWCLGTVCIFFVLPL